MISETITILLYLPLNNKYKSVTKVTAEIGASNIEWLVNPSNPAIPRSSVIIKGIDIIITRVNSKWMYLNIVTLNLS